MPRARFVPAASVREVCDEYRSRGAAIDVSAEDAAALGAEPLFRRALDAVLDNAVKFAPGRPVRIDVRRVNGRVVVDVCATCIELLGPAALTREHPLEMWLRDSKVFDIFEGTGQIQRLVIARKILGYTSKELA